MTIAGRNTTPVNGRPLPVPLHSQHARRAGGHVGYPGPQLHRPAIRRHPGGIPQPGLGHPGAALRTRDPAGVGRLGQPQPSLGQRALFSRRWLLPALHPGHRQGADDQGRVPYGLHALPTGGQPRNSSGYLRVPDPGLQPVGDGGGQRGDVRRRHQPSRGVVNGVPGYQTLESGGAGHGIPRLHRGNPHLL